MKQKNLLASVALFGELYNSDKYMGVPSIIAEFIKGAMASEKKYCLSSFEIVRLLEKVYDFTIPESVIRTILITNLKSVVTVKKNIFHFNDSFVSEFTDIEKEIDVKTNIQNRIFFELVKYVSEKEKRELNKLDEDELFNNFTHFLFDNGVLEKFSNHISAFIIQNESNHEFLNCLNTIREGLVLYQGIKYTADVNDLGKWDTDLLIYLNTEYLFNALGYNGILFKEIFDDFLKLVNEINDSSLRQNKGEKISLRYFSEIQREIDGFFVTAESIKKGHRPLESLRPAMKMIIDSCPTPADIIAKKVSFYHELEAKGIKLQDLELEVNDYMLFNVEDESILDELAKIAKERGRDFDKDSCHQFLKLFTKINYLRSGNSKKPFERIGHIYITESSFAKYLGHNNLVKFNDHDTSFAKDIDFVTSRFWFKLKKGFSEKHTLPKSFDVLTKSRIILSSHINSSITKGYQKLVKDTNDGKLSKDEALARSYALREKPNTPEEITSINVDSTFEFLNNEEYLEEVFREKERKEDLLKEVQSKNMELQAEINRRDALEFEKEQKLKSMQYDQRKEDYINTNFEILRKKNWDDLRFISIIFLLNLFLAISATVLTSTTKLKEWISEFGYMQIIIIVFYALVIVIEILGSKYIFKKERIINGWNWLFVLINRKSYITFKSKSIQHFEDDFIKIEQL